MLKSARYDAYILVMVGNCQQGEEAVIHVAFFFKLSAQWEKSVATKVVPYLILFENVFTMISVN